jgi:hypothetical protein
MKITLEEFMAYARQHHGQQFDTSGGRGKFTVETDGTGLRFFVHSTKNIRPIKLHEIEQYLDRFNTIDSYKRSDYPESFRNLSYVFRIIMEVLNQRTDTAAMLGSLPSEEKEILNAPRTEQEALRKSRLGQGRFREQLIGLRKVCYVTGIKDAKFLRASHIKPWSESNNEERLDPHNGLLLCPNYDHLFDNYFISFDDSGHILVSKDIPGEIIKAFAIDTNFQGSDLGPKTKVYLSHHRERFQ